MFWNRRNADQMCWDLAELDLINCHIQLWVTQMAWAITTHTRKPADVPIWRNSISANHVCGTLRPFRSIRRHMEEKMWAFMRRDHVQRCSSAIMSNRSFQCWWHTQHKSDHTEPKKLHAAATAWRPWHCRQSSYQLSCHIFCKRKKIRKVINNKLRAIDSL